MDGWVKRERRGHDSTASVRDLVVVVVCGVMIVVSMLRRGRAVVEAGTTVTSRGMRGVGARSDGDGETVGAKDDGMMRGGGGTRGAVWDGAREGGGV